jgi:hypothetical protein
MDAQLGSRLDGSMAPLGASQSVLKQLGRKDQHGALISTLHRVTDLISIPHAKNESRIGVGNERCAQVI